MLTKVQRGLVVLVLVSLLPLGHSWAGNTHSGTGDIAEEQRAWWGDTLSGGYIVSGCRLTVLSGLGGPIPDCRAYTLNTTLPRQLEYVEDLTERTISFTQGGGTYWLIVHTSISEAIPGWTRETGTHYLWQRTPTQPVLPNRAVWLATYTYNASMQATAGTDLRPSNPIEPRVLRITDPVFGAIPNDGLDDAPAIQAAFNAAQRGNVVVKFPPGVYDVLTTQCPLIEGYNTQTAICLANTPDVLLQGHSATVRAGTAIVRLLGVLGAGSTRVHVQGLSLMGHTETLSDQKHGIIVGHKASHVRVSHTYITNFTGDCITIGGNFAGPQLGNTPGHITIDHNTLKTRYGDGVPSFQGGSQSRLALAVTNGAYVTIANNVIFGGVDLEPDITNEIMVQLHIRHNTYTSGPVQAQGTIGSNYHHDEPILPPGTPESATVKMIDGAALFQGITGSPATGLVTIQGNTMERGFINCAAGPYVCTIIGNMFQEGLIQVTTLPVHGLQNLSHVEGNVTRAPYPGRPSFIEVTGHIAASSFQNNTAHIPGGYVIRQTAGTVDIDANVYLNNINHASTAAGILNYFHGPTSVAGNNAYDQNTTRNELLTTYESFTNGFRIVPNAAPPPAPMNGDMYQDGTAGGALCWFNAGVWTKIAGPGTCE